MSERGSESGRVRRSSGESTEALIQAHHEWAALAKLAYVSKRPTPWKIVKSLGGGKMLCVPEKKSGVDYFGVTRSGAPLFIEVKRHSGGAFPLSNIEPHQMDEMRAVGSISPTTVRLLVVHWFPTNAACIRRSIPLGSWLLMAVGWSAVEEAVARGDKSMPIDYHFIETASSQYDQKLPYLERVIGVIR